MLVLATIQYMFSFKCVKSVHFKKWCNFCWNQNQVSKNDNTFERNVDCATVLLKWTDFRSTSEFALRWKLHFKLKFQYKEWQIHYEIQMKGQLTPVIAQSRTPTQNFLSKAKPKNGKKYGSLKKGIYDVIKNIS